MKIKQNESIISGEFFADADSEEFYFDHSDLMGVYNLSYYHHSELLNQLVQIDTKRMSLEQPDLYKRIIQKITNAIENYKSEKVYLKHLEIAKEA